jgi:hypothetical protein
MSRHRRWPARVVAFAALGVALLAVVGIVQAADRPMDCRFDHAAWNASRAAESGSTDRHDHSGWPVTQLLECPQLLHGRARTQVKALLGPADDAREASEWTYDIGLADPGVFGGYASDAPVVVITFDTSHRVEGVTALGVD